jgi:hypothetical protein
MGEIEATHQEYLCQITKAELVSEAPQDDKQHDVRGELEMIENGTCSLIEDPTALSTTENLIAKSGLP